VTYINDIQFPMSSHLNPEDGGNALCLETANKKHRWRKSPHRGSFVLLWWTSLSVSSCGFVFPWITLVLFILFLILCCLSWTVCYCGLICVSLLPDFMPVFILRVSLSLLLCLLVIDPDCTSQNNNNAANDESSLCWSLVTVKWNFEFK